MADDRRRDASADGAADDAGGGLARALLAGLRRLLVLIVVVAGVTALCALALGLLTGASASRSLSIGFYLVGSFWLVAGFFVGNRGPVRPCPRILLARSRRRAVRVRTGAAGEPSRAVRALPGLRLGARADRPPASAGAARDVVASDLASLPASRPHARLPGRGRRRRRGRRGDGRPPGRDPVAPLGDRAPAQPDSGLAGRGLPLTGRAGAAPVPRRGAGAEDQPRIGEARPETLVGVSYRACRSDRSFRTDARAQPVRPDGGVASDAS